MKPEAMVDAYIAEVLASPESDHEQLVAVLVARGAAAPEAVAAIHFTQIAFGRLMLQETEAKFTDEYVRMRPDGEIYDRGILPTHPMVLAALHAATRPETEAVFQRIGMSSPEVATFAHSMSRGSDLSAQTMSPVIIIDSDPTEQGVRVVKALVESELRASGEVN